MAAKHGSRRAGGRRNAAKLQDLTDRSTRGVKGGDVKKEAQIFQALSSAINDVMKSFGGALNTAARQG